MSLDIRTRYDINFATETLLVSKLSCLASKLIVVQSLKESCADVETLDINVITVTYETV